MGLLSICVTAPAILLGQQQHPDWLMPKSETEILVGLHRSIEGNRDALLDGSEDICFKALSVFSGAEARLPYIFKNVSA